MIVLINGDTLQIALAEATTTDEPEFVASWADDGANEQISRTLGETNGATPVTLVAGPASTEVRVVRGIQICNKDTADAVVTVQLNDGVNTRRIYTETIGAGGELIYDGGKWVSGGTATPAQIGALAVTNNLSDVASASAARGNLGFTDPILDKATPGDIGGTTPGAVDCTTLDARTHLRVGSTAGTEVFEVDSGADANVGIFSSDASFAEFQLIPGDGSVDMVRIRAGNDGVGRLFAANSVDALNWSASQIDANLDLDFNGNSLLNLPSGTWTPTLSATGTAGSHTYATQVGTYTRIDNVVIAHFYIKLSAKDSAISGSVQIVGLPFTAASGLDYGMAEGWVEDLTITGAQISGRLVGGATTCRLFNIVSGASKVDVAASDVSSTTLVQGTIVYEAA